MESQFDLFFHLADNQNVQSFKMKDQANFFGEWDEKAKVGEKLLRMEFHEPADRDPLRNPEPFRALFTNQLVEDMKKSEARLQADHEEAMRNAERRRVRSVEPTSPTIDLSASPIPRGSPSRADFITRWHVPRKDELSAKTARQLGQGADFFHGQWHGTHGPIVRDLRPPQDKPDFKASKERVKIPLGKNPRFGP